MRPFLQFPALFFLAPLYVPLLLRVAAATVMGAAAYIQWSRRERIAEVRFIVIGRSPAWAWISIVLHVLVALALLAGYYTQVAALVGLLLALKHFVWQHRYPELFPFARSTYILLGVICLALILSGGGALAMDLPL